MKLPIAIMFLSLVGTFALTGQNAGGKPRVDRLEGTWAMDDLARQAIIDRLERRVKDRLPEGPKRQQAMDEGLQGMDRLISSYRTTFEIVNEKGHIRRTTTTWPKFREVVTYEVIGIEGSTLVLQSVDNPTDFPVPPVRITFLSKERLVAPQTSSNRQGRILHRIAKDVRDAASPPELHPVEDRQAPAIPVETVPTRSEETRP